MSLRRYGPPVLALALLASACKDVKQQPPAPTIVIATFASPNIPTPNDLAMAAAPTLPAGMQKELLGSFVAAGGFPSDQGLTFTVPIQALDWDAASQSYLAAAAPMVDVATITPQTFALFKVDVTPPLRVDVEPATMQVAGQVLMVKKADASGSSRLAPGRYVFAMRGGASGVKTTTGLPINADTAIALTWPNKDLTVKENQPMGALPPAAVAQLEQVRGALWNPVTWHAAGALWIPTVDTAVTPAYAAVDAAFPHAETASIAAFGVDAAVHPLTDAGASQIPLPSDFMLDPTRLSPGGRPLVRNIPAFKAAAAGIATLDGFSTTGPMVAQVTGPVVAATINKGSVVVLELPPTSGANPRLVPTGSETEIAGGTVTNAEYLTQPHALNVTVSGTQVTTAIGLQPAAQVVGVSLPPLKGTARYLVVLTDGVLDTTGHPTRPSTLGNILYHFTSPIFSGGHSQVPGVSDADAQGLQAMRDGIGPILDALPLLSGNPGLTRDHVTFAYTVSTQTVVDTSLQLAAAPYSIEAGAAAGAGAAIFTPDAPPTAVTPPAGVPTTNVAGFWDVTFKSVDGIDKSTGAFRPTLAADLASPATLATLLEERHALVAVPAAGVVPACPSPPFPAGALCAKVVIVGHGLNGSKETLFAVAASLASRGFIAAAIDFPLHGGRNWCSVDADCITPTGGTGTCDKAGAFAQSAGQGDAVRPGVCDNGSTPVVFSAPGVNVASRYFLSPNFFRIRDAFRQNVLDQSTLALALSRPPTVPQPAGNPFTAVLPPGVIVDPSAVYYEGISLGSIAGTSVVATNPRISRASLDVGGGTFYDIGITSPVFQAQLAPLFTALLSDVLPKDTPFSFDMVDSSKQAFNPAVAAAFLQLTVLAKWIIDPGDPINYAQHVTVAPLPNLLANPNGSVAQAPKDALGLIDKGDTVVPNLTSDLLYGLMGADQVLYQGPGGADVPHGAIANTPIIQNDAAAFLFDLTVPASPVTLP